VVGFGARTLGDETPKYLNSPETTVFHKGRELYGFHEAREANRRLDRIVVVEGYMDVVTLSQAGVSDAVATLGTAPSRDHMERLFRTTPRVVFCFDGDDAGRRAAWRAAEILVPLIRDGWLASFAFLPDGEDPDSLVRSEGKDAFERVLSESRSLSTFLFDRWTSEVSLEDLEGRARLVELARPVLAKLAAPALQQLAIRRLSDLTGMSGPELSRLIGEGEPASVRHPPKERSRSTGRGRSSPSLVRKTISLLLHNPSLGARVQSPRRLGALGQPGMQLLVELLELSSTAPGLTTGALIERFRDREEGRHLAKLAAEEPPFTGEGLEQEFAGAIEKLEALLDEQRFAELAQAARSRALNREEEREFSRLVERPSSGRGTARPLAPPAPSGEGAKAPMTKLPRT
jgi:DNA primase